jgi:hypothetical protein
MEGEFGEIVIILYIFSINRIVIKHSNFHLLTGFFFILTQIKSRSKYVYFAILHAMPSNVNLCYALFLPEITDSFLNDHLYYSITSDCLRLDACIDVSFQLGDFKYSKAFNAFIELDFCKYVLTYGFEGRTDSLILISYKWGKFLWIIVSNIEKQRSGVVVSCQYL